MCSTTSSTTAFTFLDKMLFSFDLIEDDVFEGRSEEVVRDISNVKRTDLYCKHSSSAAPRPRLLERRIERFLAEQLELYFDDLVGPLGADLGRARQLQGGQRGARVDE